MASLFNFPRKLFNLFPIHMIDISACENFVVAMLVNLCQGHATSKVVKILSSAHHEIKTTHGITTKCCGNTCLVMPQNWLNFWGILWDCFAFFCLFFRWNFAKILALFFMVKCAVSHISGIVGPFDWANYVTLTSPVTMALDFQDQLLK